MENKDLKLLSVADYLFSLFLLLSTNVVYFVAPGFFPKELRLVVPLFTSLGILVYFLVLKKYQIHVNYGLIFKVVGTYVVLISLFLLISFLNYKFHFFHVVLFYLVIPVLFFCFCMLVFLLKRGTKLLSAIVNIAVVLAIISLFFWILAEIQYPFNSQIFINWGGKHYVPGFWGLHFLAQEPASFFGLQLVRNTGLYAEAPMFSFVLSVAFIFNLFYLKHSPAYYFRGIVLFATIITTVSTTGLLICFLALVGNLVMKHWDLYTRLPRRKKYYIWIGLGGLLLVGLSLIWINKVNTFQGSVSIRSDDIKAGWDSFLQSPIFGNGLGNFRAIKRLMASYRLMKGGNHGFSLGILQILSYGGFIFLAFYLIPLIMAFMRKHYVDAFVLLLVMVLLTLTIVNETPLLIFILIFMVCKELPNWRNEND